MRPTRGFTILELAVSLALIVTLLALLLPALTTARMAAHREECAGHQRQIFTAWQGYLTDHDDRFPSPGIQPAWRYGGVRFSSSTSTPYIDFDRPLNAYLPMHGADECERLFCCPADRGITDRDGEIGTGRRTAFRSYGTSYRANAALLDARQSGLDDELRGLRMGEIVTTPSRMLLMGDPIWFEIAEQTDRLASWHGDDGAGNLLFLNGSIRFMTVMPRTQIGPVVFEPVPAQR